MTRVRRVPTSMRSAPHLVRALQSLGLKQVELHTTPQPLMSWRGKPTEFSAEIIVRRGSIGSTADDLGFARTRDGTFEGIVTEIHYYRYEKRWFSELTALYDAQLAADGGLETAPPTWVEPPVREQPVEKPRFARTPPSTERKPAPTHASTPQASSAPTRPVLVEATRASVGSNAEVGVQAVMARIKRENRSAGLGCLAVFVVWFIVAASSLAAGKPALAAFATFGAVVLASSLAKKRLKHVSGAAAEEFRMRFHRSITERDEALQILERLLDRADTGHKATLTALLTRLRVGR